MRKAVWFAGVIVILFTVILLGAESIPTAAQGPTKTPRLGSSTFKDKSPHVSAITNGTTNANRSITIRITWIDNAALWGNSRGIAIHTAIKVVGYKNQPVYARVAFYRNKNGQPGLPVGGPKLDNNVMKLVPPYDSTEWKDATFWYPYNSFPTFTPLYVARALVDTKEPNTMPYLSQPVAFTVPVRID